MSALSISEVLEDGVRVIAPEGRLDPVGGPVLETCCLERIGAGDLRIVLDFSGVDFVSSAGLRGILVVMKAIGAARGRMVLCGLRPMVARVFEHSGFVKIMQIVADRDAACAAVRLD